MTLPHKSGVGDGYRQRRDPRVGEHDIEATQFLQAAIQGGGECIEVTNVGLVGHDATVLPLDQAHRLIKIGCTGKGIGDGIDVLAQVHGDDVHASLGQGHGVRASLPASRTGDKGNFPLQILHWIPPPAAISLDSVGSSPYCDFRESECNVRNLVT